MYDEYEGTGNGIEWSGVHLGKLSGERRAARRNKENDERNRTRLMKRESWMGGTGRSSSRSIGRSAGETRQGRAGVFI